MGWECSFCEPIKRRAWPAHYLSNKRIQPPVQCKQCHRAESIGSPGLFRGRWLSKSWAPSSDQHSVSRDHHALRKDHQTHPVRAAGVCSPYCSRVCDNGEVRRPHTWCQRTGSNRVLAGGGGLRGLCDLCNSAGVGSPEICDHQEEEVRLRDHTVVSTGNGCSAHVTRIAHKIKASYLKMKNKNKWSTGIKIIL